MKLNEQAYSTLMSQSQSLKSPISLSDNNATLAFFDQLMKN